MTNHLINSNPAPYPYFPLAAPVPCGICGKDAPAPTSIEIDPMCKDCYETPTVDELMTLMGLD
jgi:hypothetical protein